MELLKTHLRTELSAKRLNNIDIMYSDQNLFGEELLDELEKLIDYGYKGTNIDFQPLHRARARQL